VQQSLHTGARIGSPLHVFKDGITTAEIRLEQVMGEAAEGAPARFFAMLE
jgi:kynurenine formamidase